MLTLVNPLDSRSAARVVMLFVFVLAGLAYAQSARALNVVVTPDTVTVTGVTPGNTVVLFTVGRTTRNRHMHLETWGKILSDEDGDGVVSYTPHDPIPLRSVWVAADYATAEHATGAHPDFPLYLQTLPGANLKKDAAGELAALELEIPRLMLLLVRPGKGAWILYAVEGGRGDSDEAPNKKLLMRFEEAVPVNGREPAPKRLKAGDFVAAIDPGQLDVWIGAIAK